MIKFVLSAVKARTLVIGLFLIQCVLAGPLAFAQQQNPTPDVSDQYVVDQNFLQLPQGRTLGSTASIDVSKDGESLWVFDRCSADNCVGSDLAPIMQFDIDGNFIRSFGAGMFVRPHGTHIDHESNLWVTDGEGPGTDDPRRDGIGHQVFKFSPEGELLMTLGKPGIAGTGNGEFNQPSDVQVAR